MGTTDRIAGAAGIAWAVVNVGLGFSAGSPPALDDPAAAVRDYLADGRGTMLASAAAFAITIPLLLVFFGGLIGRLRDSDRPEAPLATGVAQAGLGLFVALFSMAYVVGAALLLESSVLAGADDGLVRAVFVLSFLVTMLGNVGAGTALLALAAPAGVLGPVARPAAAVIGTLSIVVSAVGMVNGDVAMIAGLSFALIGAWMLCLGIAMVRHHGDATVAVPAGA